jgi:hypothetical protein
MTARVEGIIMTSHSLRFAPRFLFLFAAAIAAMFAAVQLQAATERTFDPEAFFVGSTEGHGTLKKTMSARQTTHVTGTGKKRADGQLVIDQVVKIQGEPTKTRQWLLRETKPGSYSGTISDAKGNVTAWVDGSKLHIKYTMKEGNMSVSQVLTMAQDGKSVQNSMKIRRFGIVFATIDETIRKL